MVNVCWHNTDSKLQHAPEPNTLPLCYWWNVSYRSDPRMSMITWVGDLRQQDEIPSQVTQENGSMWLECFLTIRVQRFCQPQTVQLCLQPWLPPTLTPHQPLRASTRVADLLLNTIILRGYSWYLVKYLPMCEINNSSLSWSNRLISAEVSLIMWPVNVYLIVTQSSLVHIWTHKTSINKRYY